MKLSTLLSAFALCGAITFHYSEAKMVCPGRTPLEKMKCQYMFRQRMVWKKLLKPVIKPGMTCDGKEGAEKDACLREKWELAEKLTGQDLKCPGKSKAQKEVCKLLSREARSVIEELASPAVSCPGKTDREKRICEFMTRPVRSSE